MSIQVNKGDYLIVVYDSKNTFVKVTKAGNKTIRVVGAMEQNTNNVFEIFPEDIKANLGNKPARAKVLGVDTSRFVESYQDKYLDTDITLIAHLPKEINHLPKDIIKYTKRIIEKNNLAGLLPFNFILDYDPKSKMGGYYTPKPKEYDTLSVNLAHCMNKEDINHIVAHELGHGFWYHLLISQKLKTHWIREFLNYFQVSIMDKKDYKKLRDDFIKSKTTINQYKKTIEDELQKELFVLVIKEICRMHRMKPEHLNTLNTYLDPDCEDVVKKLWPPFPLILVRVAENQVSTYSQKNPEEFFCEVFANYINGVTIPKHIKKLMEKTITQHATSKRRVLLDEQLE